MTSRAEQGPDGAKHVVIVGGGFDGLKCARKLNSHSNVRITLIDRHNYREAIQEGDAS
jgi:NADH dehydrogenase FAD-containing subunit